MAALSTPALDIRPADTSLELRLGLDLSTLAYAYCRWRAEDLFPLIFHRNPEMSLVDFFDWSYQPTVEPVGVFAGDQLIGIGWICQARRINEQLVAEVGAAFFRGTKPSILREGLDLLLRHAFVDRNFSKVYTTGSPANRAAEAFPRWCGMEITEHLPWDEEVGAGDLVYALDWMTWAGRSRHGKRG